MNHPHRKRLYRLRTGFLACAVALLLAACDKPGSTAKTAAPAPAVETPRGWDIPTDPQEKAAYDYAHSLKLPDSVPKPVPFDFAEAERKAKTGGPDVSEQYFEHLCKTEAGEYIFKTVENVEGVFQMRPNPVRYGSPIDYDRYAMEAPIIVRPGDWNNKGNLRAGEHFVQPMMGKYLFLEQPKPGDLRRVIRLVRRVSDNPPPSEKNGYQTAFVSPTGQQIFLSLPFMIDTEEDANHRARYGFTWRGIKRERDREHSIAGGEYLMVDLETNEVLGAKRTFVLSGRDKNTPSRIWWGNAKSCNQEEWGYHQPVERVFRPIVGLNDQYLPK